MRKRASSAGPGAVSVGAVSAGGLNRRRRVLAGVGAGAAVVLVAASGAMACTYFRGKLKLVGNALSTPVVAIGNGGSMSWCGSPTGTAIAKANGGTVKVVVKPAPSRCASNATSAKLPKGTYDINFANGAAMTKGAAREWVIDCMSGLTHPSIVRLGGLFVNRYGLGGPKTYTLPPNLVANGPSDESAVCISDPGGVVGNQAPLTIL